MKLTGPITKLASTPNTGLFTLLSNLLRTHGSGASSSSAARRRGVLLLALTFAATLGALALVTAPALAAAPEAPELTVEAHVPSPPSPSTEAVLHGVLNPSAEGVAGTYQFLYKASKTQSCEGESHAPASPGLSFGGDYEELPAETISGLKPDTEYAVCLLAETTPMEKTLSAPVTFTTALEPEKPETLTPAKSVTATTAILEGVLNPKAAVKAGWYFAYSTEAACTDASTSAQEPEVVVKAKTVSIELTELQPNKKYEFCLVATNEAGEAVAGNEVSFETEAAPPTVLSESAPAPTAHAATLNAQVNPNNQETKYSFQYGTSPTLVGATTLPEVEPPLSGFSPEGQTASVATGEVLTQATIYYYRIVAKNAKGEEADGNIEHFVTGPPAEPETISPATSITASTAALKGVLNPTKEGAPGSYEFLYRESKTECQGEGEKQTYTEGADGESPEHVGAQLTELLPNATYSFCLLARNEAGETTVGPAVQLTTLSVKSTFTAESTSNVTATSAGLNAAIDPQGLPVISCTFEYGTSTEYGHSVSCEHPSAAELGSGRAPVAVSQEIAGLSENTTYHWRLLATNAAGTTTGPDQTFVYDTSGEGLPDDRAYEMVTPPHKDGALIGQTSGIQPDIAEDGSRVILTSIQCFADAESCNAGGAGDQVGQQFLFSRTSTGWVTSALTPPASRFEVNIGLMVSAETGMELLIIPTPPLLETDFYVRGADGAITDIGPMTPPADGASDLRSLGFAKHATSDFSRVVFTQYHAPWPFESGGVGLNGQSLVEFSGTGNAAPVLVGVTGGPGSTSLISKCSTSLGPGSGDKSEGVMSTDGEVVYFTAESCPEGGTGTNAGIPVPVAEIFARVGEARTVAISEPSAFSEAAPYPGCSEEPCIKDVNEQANWSEAEFVGASDDGSKVYFTSYQQLTDGASQGSDNLYEYDMDNPPGENLIDVSAGDASGEGPRVEGVVAMSSDGSHVYFAAQSVLSATANGEGEKAQDGANNLYVFERDAEHQRGQIEFVAPLPESDGEAEWGSNGVATMANVTPDGRFLVFESHGDLTPDATRTDGAKQIYRYDAQTGELTRVSIGEHGFNDGGNAGVGDARIVEASKGMEDAGAPRTDPTMSNDGSFVFFESPIALTPHAINDLEISSTEHPYYHFTEPHYAENVYEWHEGQVYLISDGRDTAGTFLPGCRYSATCLIGSDATGHNVFFYTADPLVAQDTDTQVDVYDARICEPENGNPCSSPPPPPLPPCLGEACHGTPAAQLAPPSGGSLTLNGQGNLTPLSSPAVKPKSLTRTQVLAKALKACKKKPKKKRAMCEKQARNRYGVAKARKSAKTNRGAK